VKRLLGLLMTAAGLFGQVPFQPQTVVAAGANYEKGATGVSTAFDFAERIAQQNAYSFTSITSVNKKAQFQTGVATQSIRVGKFSFYTLAIAGAETGGAATLGSFSAGGFGAYEFGADHTYLMIGAKIVNVSSQPLGWTVFVRLGKGS
jgi:hypothetical protein